MKTIRNPQRELLSLPHLEEVEGKPHVPEDRRVIGAQCYRDPLVDQRRHRMSADGGGQTLRKTLLNETLNHGAIYENFIA